MHRNNSAHSPKHIPDPEHVPNSEPVSTSAQKSYHIYYPPSETDKWISVSEEFYFAWRKDINALVQSRKRAGYCHIPHEKQFLCYGHCEGHENDKPCEFCYPPKDAPKHFSLDWDIVNAFEDSLSCTNILFHPNLSTEISLTSIMIRSLLSQLQRENPEDHQILILCLAGMTESESGAIMGITRDAFRWKRDKLIKRIRKMLQPE